MGTSEEGRARLAAAAVEAVPSLAGQPIAEHWFGFRPGTPDDLPILGRDPAFPALVYAFGTSAWPYSRTFLSEPLSAPGNNNGREPLTLHPASSSG